MPVRVASERRDEAYAQLVRERKECTLCRELGLHNPAVPKLERFDSDEIGPWTRWLGDRNARLMIVGQDWGDVTYFQNNEGFDDCCTNNPTNRNLQDLLHGIGLPVSSGPQRSSGVFLTNAVLCLKEGGLQAEVEEKAFKNCREFLRRQIEVISPAVVVTLGKRAYGAVVSAFGRPREPTFRAAVERENIELFSDCRLVPVYHCGRKSTNMNRDIRQQRHDWARVERALRHAGAKYDLEGSHRH